MATVDPYADLDAHERLMAQLQAATDSCLQVVSRAREVLTALEEHNESDTSHADLRQIIRSAAFLTDDDMDTQIRVHNSSEQAHPYLIAHINDVQAALQTSIETIRTQISNLQTKDNSLQAGLTSLESALATANTKITNLQNSLNTANGKITTLQGQVASLTTTDELLTGRMESAEGNISTHSNQISSINAQLSALGTADSQLAARLGTVEAASASHGTAITEMKATQTSQANKLIEVDDAILTLQQNYNAAQGNISSMADEINVIQRRMDAIDQGGSEVVYPNYVIEIPDILAPQEGEKVQADFTMIFSPCVTRKKTAEDDTWYINPPKITTPWGGETVSVETGTFLMTWTEADVRTLSDLDISEWTIERPAITTPYDGSIITLDNGFMMKWTDARVRQYSVSAG